jgi:transposase-like protein
MSRFRLIQPYLEERRSLQLVATDANLSFRTAQRWVSQYRKHGLAAFVRKAHHEAILCPTISLRLNKLSSQQWVNSGVRSAALFSSVATVRKQNPQMESIVLFGLTR